MARRKAEIFRGPFWFLLIAIIILMLPYSQAVASGIGGYISEKLISRIGVASSSLLIGTTSELTGSPSGLDVAMGPIVSTLPAQVTTGIHSATLRGNVSTLNGFPLATVWFEWGYGTSYSNTVGTQTVTSTGEFTFVLTDFSNKANEAHYRACASTDGIAYGSDSSFDISQSIMGVLAWLIPVAFMIFGIVVLFMFKGNVILLVVIALTVAIGALILTNVVSVLW